MIETISVNIDSKGRVKTSSKVLCNQYETGVAKFDIDVPSDWQDDSYYYYLGVVPPSSTGLKQYVVPLTRFEFQITSGITWHLGTWYFVFMVLNTELPNTGDIPQENIVSISNAWEGYVNKSVLKPSDLERQQPVDPNFELLYSDLMALSARVEVQADYAEAQGDYAKGVGEQLLQDKEDGVFDGADGQDGTSPTVAVHTSTSTEYTLDFIDVNGTTTTPNLIGPQGEQGVPGTTTYSDLSDKPSINGVTLSGNKTSSDLGLNSQYLALSGGSMSGSIDMRGYAINGAASMEVTTSPFSSTNVVNKAYADTKEAAANKTTTISSSSTDTQYPSAKAVYDYAASKALYGDTTINTGRAANTTVGANSTALGYPNTNTASARDAVALGIENAVTGNDAFAMGECNTVSGEASFVGGMDNTVSGAETFVYGDGINASGECSVGLGRLSLVSSDNQVVVGRMNVEDSNNTYSEIVGNGQWVVGTGAVRSNARTTDWNGNGWFAGDVYVGSTSGTNKDSGSKKLATEDYVINNAFSTTNLTVTSNATNLVDVATTAGFYKVPSNCWIYSDSTSSTANRIYGQTGDIVHIEPQIEDDDGEGNISYITYFTVYSSQIYRGAMTTTDNTTYTSSITSYESQSNKVTTIASNSSDIRYPSAHAVYTFAAQKSKYGDTAINLGRKDNTTTGSNSVAAGYTATASGDYSTAFGYNPTASGDHSFAAGRNPTASGDYSAALGQNCTSSGGSSLAEGALTTSGGNGSHTEGFYTQSQRAYQHVEGTCNIVDTSGNTTNDKGSYIHIAGNGTANNARSNAHTLDWSGNAWFAGDVYVGSTSGTNKDAGSKKLATEDYINSLVSQGAEKTILYNGKANGTAILSGTTYELPESIFNFDLIIVAADTQVTSNLRAMEVTAAIYPHSDLITFCDSTGTGATGVWQIFNCNTNYTANGNAYRVMWGFTDATHIRNVLGTPVNTWTNPGICYVVGYKFKAVVLPGGNNVYDVVSISDSNNWESATIEPSINKLKASATTIKAQLDEIKTTLTNGRNVSFEEKNVTSGGELHTSLQHKWVISSGGGISMFVVVPDINDNTKNYTYILEAPAGYEEITNIWLKDTQF